MQQKKGTIIMLIEVSQDLGIMRRIEIVSRSALDDRAGVMDRLK